MTVALICKQRWNSALIATRPGFSSYDTPQSWHRPRIMFEDHEVQDPLSLSLNENYDDQSTPGQEPRGEEPSPSYNCETPEIQVIIKEEEEGWTVSENNEGFSLVVRKDATSPDTCLHYLKASREESSISSGLKIHQRAHPVEKRSEKSDDQAIFAQSFPAKEEQPRQKLPDFNEKLQLSCLCGKTPGNVHECSNTGEKPPSLPTHKTTSSHKRNVKPHVGTLAEEDRNGQEQSTPLHPEELHQTRTLALYQTDSPEHNRVMSHGIRTASADLKDQTLHLSVRVQAAEKDDEVDQDEEIGGLINSDGEVIEWDAKDASDQGSDCTEGPKTSQVQGQSQKDCSSPTLIMEVVSVEEDEGREEEEQKERVVKMTALAPLQCGKRPRRNKKVPREFLESSDTEKVVPTNVVKRRGRRKISKSPPLCAQEEVSVASRRSQRKRNVQTPAEPEELNTKTVRRVSAKRPYRKRKDAKLSADEEELTTGASAGKKRPGRKMVHVPIEIPPELLKKPKEKMEYRCSICGKEFPHAYKLERHELIHTGEKPYCCSICGRGFNQKGNLKTHYKVHLGRKGAFETDDDASPTESELSEYLKSLPGESKIRSSLRCLECGKDCESQAALQAHHITTHSEAPPAVEHSTSQFLFCRRCGIQFDGKEKMEEHMKTHIKEKPYSCPDCGKRFINESYIQIHQRIHTGEKPFLCSQCGRGFHTASSLKLHEMQHSGERPFACSICGKTFRINSYLTAHYQTHIKDRPFICSVCGKGYSRAEELKVHHRLHTGERPYECGECGKSFIYRQGLRQHQRTHAGRRIGPTRQLGRPKQKARLEI